MDLPLGPGHVFLLGKYSRAGDALRAHGIPAAAFASPAEMTWEELASVHTPEYLADLRGGRHTSRTIPSEIDLTPAIIDAFRRMAAGTVAAARAAMRLGAAMNLGGGFHHAFRDRPEGFCYLNDIALAIEALRRDGAARRFAVVDCDVHQGNGTAAIYRDDPDVFTLSLHQENNYPAKQRSTLDIGLDDGVADVEYLRLLKDALDGPVARHAPEAVCYVAGADTYEDDQLGGLALTKEGHRLRDRMVLDGFASRNVPVFVTLAGGYARDIRDTVDIYAATGREVWARATPR